jgi:signal transduction histidine kinase
LITNAAYAIERTGRRGAITIATRVDASGALISVADDGTGIPESIRERVFEPFFTTKDVGRGTGQGLSISRAMIERHGGELSFESSGRGTTFYIRLPLAA